MYFPPQNYLSRQQKLVSGAFALGTHVLFLLLIVFGVTWQQKMEPTANIVDLYANLPTIARPEPAPAKPDPPPPKPEVKPEPEPKPAPKAKAEPKPAPKPDIPKADIALKDKIEKEKRAAEDKKAAEKKLEVARAAEKQKEDARLAQEKRDLERKAEEQAAGARKVSDEFRSKIQAKIQRYVVLPPSLQGNPTAEFDVILLPSGEVLAAKLKRSSGNPAYDAAVERAILKAQPLPVPPEPMFREFRELNLSFRPQDK